MTRPEEPTLATYAADLERLLLLRTHPIAIKMLTGQSDIPEEAIRPRRDRGEHYAMCQVFSLARRQGLTLAVFLEDHWCYAPIISYGLVEPPEDYLEGFTHSFFIADREAARRHATQTARLSVGEYPGIVVGPLAEASYAPDLVMIYCTPEQLRHLLLCLRYLRGTEVTSTLDPIGSCIHSVVPPLLTGEPAVTVPDPGDYERAAAGGDEMVLTVPTDRLQELMAGVYHFQEMGMGFRTFAVRMEPDFKQPPFYEEYFRTWGLDRPAE